LFSSKENNNLWPELRITIAAGFVCFCPNRPKIDIVSPRQKIAPKSADVIRVCQRTGRGRHEGSTNDVGGAGRKPRTKVHAAFLQATNKIWWRRGELTQPMLTRKFFIQKADAQPFQPEGVGRP